MHHGRWNHLTELNKIIQKCAEFLLTLDGGLSLKLVLLVAFHEDDAFPVFSMFPNIIWCQFVYFPYVISSKM
jgi:hypothetical protein